MCRLFNMKPRCEELKPKVILKKKTSSHVNCVKLNLRFFSSFWVFIDRFVVRHWYLLRMEPLLLRKIKRPYFECESSLLHPNPDLCWLFGSNLYCLWLLWQQQRRSRLSWLSLKSNRVRIKSRSVCMDGSSKRRTFTQEAAVCLKLQVNSEQF